MCATLVGFGVIGVTGAQEAYLDRLINQQKENLCRLYADLCVGKDDPATENECRAMVASMKRSGIGCPGVRSGSASATKARQPSRRPGPTQQSQARPDLPRFDAPERRTKRSASRAPMGNCVAHSWRESGNSYVVDVVNRCGKTVNVNICAKLPGRTFSKDRQSVQLRPGGAHPFSFFDPSKSGIRYRIRYCSPGSTTASNTCPARCP
jgi:hypothetical protein